MAKWFCMVCMGTHETEAEIAACRESLLTDLITGARMREILDAVMASPPIPGSYDDIKNRTKGSV
jgi:hypothetical protein